MRVQSPGHQVMRFVLDGTRVYYLGDLVHFPAEIDHADWLALPRDAAALAVSRPRIFRDPGDGDATFVFTHARFPAWGRIAATGRDRWAWRFD